MKIHAIRILIFIYETKFFIPPDLDDFKSEDVGTFPFLKFFSYLALLVIYNVFWEKMCII